MSPARPLLGGVELGGTKCVCVVGTSPEDIRTQVSLATGASPAVTLDRIIDVLRSAAAVHGPLRALGIASFGPIDRDAASPTFGCITTTSKPGWRNTRVVAPLAAAFKVPLAFDTDVNGAALAEHRWGAAQGVADLAYVTVGTGVGVGWIANGRLVHGFAHPELGHIRVVRRRGDDWPGICPFHGDCVEGLAAGPAIAARAGKATHRVEPDDPVWEMAAHALAQLVSTLILASAPRRILLGGGVLAARPWLLGGIRRLVVQSLNGYVLIDHRVGGIEACVTAPALKEQAGPLGALALAADAHSQAAASRP